MPHKKRKIMKTFGRNLRRFREERGITQDALAEATGISKSTVSKYESGTSDPPLQYVFTLSRIYGMKPEYFVKDGDTE